MGRQARQCPHTNQRKENWRYFSDYEKDCQLNTRCTLIEKYQRSGALIASRYKSTPVIVDEYFIPLQCYIHQNPLKAGIVVKLDEYPFSSYREYIHGGCMTDTALSLSILGREEWLQLHQSIGKDSFEFRGR